MRGPRRRRHHRGHLHLYAPDRRPDQDADLERAASRAAGRLRRRRRRRRRASERAGADVTFSTVLGDDTLKDFVLEDLKEPASSAGRSSTRPGPRPTRMRSSPAATAAQGRHARQPHHLRRIVRNLVQTIAHGRSRRTLSSSATSVTASSTARRSRLDAAIPDGVYKVADSQVASRWGNILNSRLRSDHAERARGALRARRPGFGRPAARARACTSCASARP